MAAPSKHKSTITHSISVTRYVPTSPTFNSLSYILFFSFSSPMFLISSQQHVTRLRIIQSESFLDRFSQAIVGGHHFHYINICRNLVGSSRGTCSQCVCGAVLNCTEYQALRRTKVEMLPSVGSIFP
jgi:hypothetical protein